MRFIGLRVRVLLTLLVPLAVFAPITVTIVYRSLEAAIIEQTDARGQILARQLASLIADELLMGENFAAERRMVDAVSSQPDVEYAFVVDADELLVAHTFQGGFPVDLLRLRRVGRSGEQPLQVLLGAREVHDVSASVLGGVAGYVHVGVSTEKARSSTNALLGRLSFVGVGVVLTGLALSLALSSRVINRIGRIGRAAEAIGAGDLDARVDDATDDEIGRLGRAFDEMGARVRAAREDRERIFLRLAHSEKLVAVGRLAAGVAHEINNPLTGVLHCLDVLQKSDENPEKRKRYYGLMVDGVVRGQQVVRQLLEYSRPEDIAPRPVDIRKLVPRVMELFAPAVEKGRISLTCDCESDLPSVPLDSNGIEQVLINLLLNALDATPEGGRVELEVRRIEAECRIRVRDTGAGIPAESVHRVFDPFFTTKVGAGGSGLGLSVSLGIVERHGGRIEVESALGEGTRFDVYLPLDDGLQQEVRA